MIERGATAARSDIAGGTKRRLPITKAGVADRWAGTLAVVAGSCWFGWAIANTATHQGLEHAAPGSWRSIVNASLTAGWNLLLIPAAVRLVTLAPLRRRTAAATAAAAGVVSLLLWTLGALAGNSRTLETTYLALAAVWLLPSGAAIVPRRPAFGRFTLVVGAFTALDCLFNQLEPIPFVIYLLAAPKLPLSAVWSVTLGVVLVRRGRAAAACAWEPGSGTTTPVLREDAASRRPYRPSRR